MTSAVAVQRRGQIAAVDDDSLSRLLDWVLTAAPEEIAWNHDQFSQVRDWLKAAKAATDLRIKAVRLEMIALRRVGQAGFASKLPVTQKSSATWLAELTETDFDDLLSQVSEKDTPWGLRLRASREQRDVDDNLGRRAYFNGRTPDDEEDNPYEAHALAQASADILRALGREGDSFTIAEASKRLQAALWDEHDVYLPDDLAAETLPEVIRAAIRSAGEGEFLWGKDSAVRTPVYVTFDDADGFVRIPWAKASLDQYAVMVRARARQLEAVEARYRQHLLLLELLAAVQERHPLVTSCDLLVQVAKDEGTFRDL